MKSYGKRWSDEEINLLTEIYYNTTIKELCVLFKRKEQQIRHKAHYLGLTKHNRKKLPGERFLEHLKSTGLVLDNEYLGVNDKSIFICPQCGKKFESFPHVLMSKKKYSCGCVSFGKRTGGEYISGSYIGQLRRGAKYRNMEFNLSSDYLDNLLQEQNFKCAISNLDLKFGYIPTSEYTASLDRKDSELGYIESNVWWVHRDINICKQSFSTERYIELCRLVTNNNLTLT